MTSLCHMTNSHLIQDTTSSVTPCVCMCVCMCVCVCVCECVCDSESNNNKVTLTFKSTVLLHYLQISSVKNIFLCYTTAKRKFSFLISCRCLTGVLFDVLLKTQIFANAVSFMSPTLNRRTRTLCFSGQTEELILSVIGSTENTLQLQTVISFYIHIKDTALSTSSDRGRGHITFSPVEAPSFTRVFSKKSASFSVLSNCCRYY